VFGRASFPPSRGLSPEADGPGRAAVGPRRQQRPAILEWGIRDASQVNRLAGITQPTLVANGDNDRMIPTINSQIPAVNRFLDS
jgi:hypothetical protein